MSLLLTRYIDQNGINLPALRDGRRGPYNLSPAGLEPLANQITMETIMFDDQDAFHWSPRR